MQVSENAAKEWAEDSKVENFQVEEYSIRKQSRSGARGICAGPMVICRSEIRSRRAAEYNAGASALSAGPAAMNRRQFRHTRFGRISRFPGTRKYVDSIIARYDFYKRRGRCSFRPPAFIRARLPSRADARDSQSQVESREFAFAIHERA